MLALFRRDAKHNLSARNANRCREKMVTQTEKIYGEIWQKNKVRHFIVVDNYQWKMGNRCNNTSGTEAAQMLQLRESGQYLNVLMVSRHLWIYKVSRKYVVSLSSNHIMGKTKQPKSFGSGYHIWRPVSAITKMWYLFNGAIILDRVSNIFHCAREAKMFRSESARSWYRMRWSKRVE